MMLATFLFFAVAVQLAFAGMMGCNYKMFNEPARTDRAFNKFFDNTKGSTNWPRQFKARWDAKDPCAWDGNGFKHPAPAGVRCFAGGWHALPPAGDGGCMWLEHFSGFAEGPVPEEFDAFQMTDFIGLGGNKLNGPIWNTSFHCFLHKLDLWNNQMTGPLGEDFMIRNTLHGEHINFGGNKFSGEIPQSINELVPLTVLLLNDNQFSGKVPDLSKAQKLRHLDLSNNQLTGTVDPWLKELKNLAWIGLDGNNMAGALPELPQSVTHFSAANSKFSGKIPESYGNLPFLRHFNCTGCTIECPTPGFLDHVYFSTHCRRPRKWDE